LLATNSHPYLLRPDQTIVVVIDMQETLLHALYNGDQLLANVRTLLQCINVLRVPTVSTTQNAEKLGQIVAPIRALLPVLLPPFDKMNFSCLGSPAFTSELQRAGRKQVLLCGAETHICVSQTALELSAAGFQVHVAVDAVSSRTETNWRVGLDKMRQCGILHTSVEMAAFELTREAGTPEFREVLKIVK
jgi:nicotinamidase-related amidase